MNDKIYNCVLDKINTNTSCALISYLNFTEDRKGIIEKKILLTEEEIENPLNELPSEVYETARISLNTGKIQSYTLKESMTIYAEPIIPKPRLIIFGGGHIGKPLCELSSKVGFSVTLIDDRPFFANYERFPSADNVICDSFENSFKNLSLKKSDFVVIITRGHKHDGIVLREVLKHDLSYIGMIGSKRRVRGMMDELKGEGYSEDILQKVCSPIGLDIAAITPDEISVSIVAQLISYKNKGIITKLGKSFSFPEFDREVYENIYKESYIPKALVTILSSKGSVPRKAGAKMIAFYDGRTIGSIGGGCSEADVITKARDIMGSNNFLIVHVDMTGDVAESIGMVCGGTMEVLIESI